MKVICPKCQFENQADSTRVVCARCATIIEVRVDQGSGFDSNGKRQTARLPFAANSNSGNLNSGNFGRGNSGPLGGGQQNRDAYATRIGDDFDDVLEIPRPVQNEFSNTAEATPVFEDVFSTANYDSASNYDFSAYEKKPTAPTGPYPTDLGSQRVTQDYTAPAEPEFMGWPVLPENNLEEEDAAAGYSNNRGGVFTRIALLVAAFGVLSFLAYYFLWDYVVKRQDKADQINASAIEAPGSQPQVGAVNPPPAEVKPNPVAQADPPKTTVTPPIISKVDPPPNNTKQGTTIDIPLVKPSDVTGPKGPSQSPKPAPAVQETPNRGNLTVQAGSFPDKGQADERISRLKAAGVDARAVRADIPGRGTWYRVQIGGFPAREEATRYGNQLRSKGLVQDFIVVTIGKP
ncbi:MAG: SPOR domain-containing protein [Blastocatellia bacterium]